MNAVGVLLANTASREEERRRPPPWSPLYLEASLPAVAFRYFLGDARINNTRFECMELIVAGNLTWMPNTG